MNKYLLVFIVCGLTFLIDIDHFISLLIQGIPITLNALNTQGNRFLHLPILYLSSFYVGFESIRYIIKKK